MPARRLVPPRPHPRTRQLRLLMSAVSQPVAEGPEPAGTQGTPGKRREHAATQHQVLGEDEWRAADVVRSQAPPAELRRQCGRPAFHEGVADALAESSFDEVPPRETMSWHSVANRRLA